MPPSAAATLPTTRNVAVECAPRSAPNSSLSISASGMAAQLIATKGPDARGLLPWMTRASADLPVPDGPVIKTSTCSGAASAAPCSTSASARDRPTTPAHWKRLRISRV